MQYLNRINAMERQIGWEQVYHVLWCWVENEYGVSNCIPELERVPLEHLEYSERLTRMEQFYGKEQVYLLLWGWLAKHRGVPAAIAELEQNGRNY